MTPLTPEVIERLEELLSKATKGPFAPTYIEGEEAYSALLSLFPAQSRIFCLTAPSKAEGKVAVVAMLCGEEPVDRDNAWLLPEALNALPSLLEERASNLEEIERLKKALEQLPTIFEQTWVAYRDQQEHANVPVVLGYMAFWKDEPKQFYSGYPTEFVDLLQAKAAAYLAKEEA